MAAHQPLASRSLALVPDVLLWDAMKPTMIALLALAYSATVWAGAFNPGPTVPDAGSSLLLLGIGMTVIGVVRRTFRR